ncbi:MAG: peptidoglycan editing factor PgeF [Rickettsiales bacterium]|nr:peptidoglycan editing factor PgeF [Rickettsiales bacterium]
MIKYNFFGKDCIIDRELRDRSNLALRLQEKNFSSSNALFVNQIHGNEVIKIDDLKKIHGDQNLPKADALVTNLPNLAIAVITADCAPILFFDQEEKVIAAAHAGWRGAKNGIIKSTISAMKNLQAKNITAVIGPMIQQNSYEVSQDFFADFLSEDSENKEFFKNSEKPNKYWFDLPSYIEKKLRQENIFTIINLAIDTYKNEKDFFSFRRSTHLKESDCGRNVSVIEVC